MYRKIGEPRLADAAPEFLAAHADSEIGFKSRSVSPIHARSIGLHPLIR